MKWAIGAGIVVLLAVFGGWNAMRLGPPAAWAEGERRGSWKLVFASHGSAREDDGEVYLRPTPPKGPDSTYAGLAVSATDYPPGTDFTVTVETLEQLRDGEPNAWEVAWVLWNYRDNDHFYAVALKPNGWEVSKQDPAYPGKQRFIKTGNTPRFPIGREYEVRVEQSDGEISVSVDGERLCTFRDAERPYTRGSIGLYTEDAEVRFSDLRVDTQPSSTSP